MLNPADSETGTGQTAPVLALQQAVSHQGILLGQHEQLLHRLTEHNQALLDQITQLTGQVTRLSAQIAQAPPPPTEAPVQPVAAPVGLPHAREPFVPVPERYGGDFGSCQAFLTQVSLVFELQPQSYASDRARIAYLIGLLTGSAREWGAAIWERQSEECNSYVAFTNVMRKTFDHPVKGRDAGNRLLSIRQGARSVAEFALDFRTLAAESGWNEEALLGAFYKGLNENLKDELAARDDVATLERLIELTIRLDNRLRERRRERALRVPNIALQSSAALLPTPSSHPPSEPEPMQLGRIQLSPQERSQRRAANACLYCGGMGHYIAKCPKKAAKGPAHL